MEDTKGQTVCNCSESTFFCCETGEEIVVGDLVRWQTPSGLWKERIVTRNPDGTLDPLDRPYITGNEYFGGFQYINTDSLMLKVGDYARKV